MNPAALLEPEQVARTHEASLEVLERVGLLVHHEPARDVFARHGCRVDRATNRVTFPPAVVETYRRMVPAAFTFHGRDARWDRTIPGDGPLIVTGSSAPDLVDRATGAIRRARAADVADIARLIQALPAYDVFSISTLAEDAPPGRFTAARLLPTLRHCAKPVRVTTTDRADAEAVLRMLYAVAGGEAAYRARPFVTHHYCPVVSPLTMDRLSTDALMFFCEQGLPAYPSIVPTAGLTAPMTLAGTLVQGNAEFLAATVLMQMVRERTPTIYATLPTAADMRTGAYASGGIECGILHMAFAQLARFYGVPCGGYVGLTNSKLNDAQAGYETGLSAVAGVLGGMDMLNVGGLLGALTVFDFAKAVTDDEIGRMLKHVKRGIAFDEEALAIEIIAETGPGGSFIAGSHTAEHMRTEALLPALSDRDPRPVWEGKGALDAHARARARVEEILATPSPALLSPAVEARIRKEFPELTPAA